ncbi:MAG: LamG-like jellyroll fold domain-containing protein [Bacteroidota bacterium]|nr:LamG-like jellyroll fold domain-containing protein [Bacteroidota bacterium]
MNTSIGQVNLSKGLVAYFPFEGNSFDSISPNATNNNTGALLTQNRQGRKSKAMDFLASNENYIDVGTNLSYFPVSISVWIMPRYCPNIGVIFSNEYNLYQWTTTAMELMQLADGTIRFGMGNSSNGQSYKYIESANQVKYDGSWYHIVATCDQNYNCEIYIDKVRDRTGKLSLGNFVTCINNANIGARPIAALVQGGMQGHFYNGVMDELRIYNRVLDTSDIDALFNLDSSTLAAVPYIETAEPNINITKLNGIINILSDLQIEKVKIYDMMGRQVYTKTVNALATQITDMSNQNGNNCYIIEILCKNNLPVRQKIIL